ncbi:MAG TPA: glycine cleavage system aminomethyltransferase GcvT [Stellaceae bacterium]|nr:glycine cleavage system aminomethyltransferase GcvT [Stellaceae bacterium]
MADPSLNRTPLHALHQSLGAKLVAFAGYDMPLQYAGGIMAEHLHTRAKAGLFDVSHMGQARLEGEGAAEALERLVPADIKGLAPGRMRYTLFTNDTGGILDDLMVTRAEDHFFLVVNAARKQQDFAHLERHLEGRARLTRLPDRALLALQGPAAASVIARLAPAAAALPFMAGAALAVDGHAAFVTRSGYTGEDGFEISVPAEAAEPLARRLLAESEVQPAGLGARDSLRLEAGLCLWGHDIDETTTAIEADLGWTIQKRRRVEGGFPGAAVILRELASGARRKRIGIRPEGRAPAREGTVITGRDGTRLGSITSGGFGPSVDGPVAMGYVEVTEAALGTPLQLLVRGTPRPARIVPLPFVPHRYHRGSPPRQSETTRTP